MLLLNADVKLVKYTDVGSRNYSDTTDVELHTSVIEGVFIFKVTMPRVSTLNGRCFKIGDGMAAREI